MLSAECSRKDHRPIFHQIYHILQLRCTIKSHDIFVIFVGLTLLNKLGIKLRSYKVHS